MIGIDAEIAESSAVLYNHRAPTGASIKIM